MALPDNVKPFHVDELISFETGETYAASQSIAGEITAAKAAIDVLIDAIIAGGPQEAGEYYYDALIALKTSQAAAIDAEITTPVITNVSIPTVLEEVKADLEAEQASEDLTLPCPECQTTGKAPTYNPDGSLSAETVVCPTCSGNGYTPSTEPAYQLDGNSKRFIQITP